MLVAAAEWWSPTATAQVEDELLQCVMKETQERVRLFEENQRQWQQSPPVAQHSSVSVKAALPLDLFTLSLSLSLSLFLGSRMIAEAISLDPLLRVGFTSKNYFDIIAIKTLHLKT